MRCCLQKRLWQSNPYQSNDDNHIQSRQVDQGWLWRRARVVLPDPGLVRKQPAWPQQQRAEIFQAGKDGIFTIDGTSAVQRSDEVT